MLNEEVAKYRELSGDTNPNTPISRIGGYLDGYEKALEQSSYNSVKTELNGDTISRQAVLDEAFEVDTKEYGRIDVVGVDAINSLSPVTPQPEMGKWIVHEKPHGKRYLECPYCNIWYLNEHLIRNSFCPNCGCRMIEPQERSE